MIRRIAAPDVQVTLTAPVRKLCPVKDEVDEGTVTLSYRTGRLGALELHDLAAYFAGFTGRHLSHEEFTFEVARATGAEVSSSWETAGITYRVELP